MYIPKPTKCDHGGRMNRGKYMLPVIVMVAAAGLLVGCGSGGPGDLTPEEVQSMQQRVESNTQGIDTLQKTTAAQAEQLGSLSDQTAQIKDRVSLLESRMDFIDSTRFEVLQRLEDLESGGGMATTGQQAQDTAPLTDTEYRSLYDRAYNQYQQSNYQEAMSLFTRVLEARPEGDLSDNAQYWIGECYYGLKNYTRAIVEFEKVFTFKESNKDDDAQLKLGLCYLNLGQKDKARDEFQRLVDFYPDSEYRSTAVKYLNQL